MPVSRGDCNRTHPNLQLKINDTAGYKAEDALLWDHARNTGGRRQRPPYSLWADVGTGSCSEIMPLLFLTYFLLRPLSFAL